MQITLESETEPYILSEKEKDDINADSLSDWSAFFIHFFIYIHTFVLECGIIIIRND